MSEVPANHQSASESEKPRSEARVDPAHISAHVPQSSVEPEPRIPFVGTPEETFLFDEPAAALVRQLRTQVAQLAKHLAAQQQQLDHRESEVHAQSAALEKQARAARLWLNERQQQLAERETELAQREKAAISPTAHSLDRGSAKRPTGEGAPPVTESGPPSRQADTAGSIEHQADDGEPAPSTQISTPLRNNLPAEEHEERRRELKALYDELERREASLAQRLQHLESEKAELEERHRQLDAREADMHQRVNELCRQRAEFSGDRVACEQLRGDLAARCIELDARKEQLDELASRFEQQRRDLAEHEQEMVLLTAEMTRREQKLQERGEQIKTALLRFERLGVTEQRMHQLEREVADFHVRRQHLDEAESLLAGQQVALEAAQRNLHAEQQRHQQQVRHDLGELALKREADATELDRRSRELERRSAHLNRRQAAIEEMRSEAEALQRDMLELRLATEELWAQLSGPVPPASLSESLSVLRRKMAEHYHQANAGLDQRKRQLVALGHELAEHHQHLANQKQSVEKWADLQRQEIEQQAARLVAREQELDRDQTSLRQLQRQWEHERSQYQAQIRNLLARLRGRETAAAC